MNNVLRSRLLILITLAVIVAIALAFLVVRSFVIGDTDYDVDDAVPSGALTS